MFMDMNFPHPRRVKEAGLTKANYFDLVASATASQATSQTVSALLKGSAARLEEVDGLESRMAFFGKGGTQYVNGAFLPQPELHFIQEEKFECAVNPADSVNSKFICLETVKPELQVAERGTEF
jgi:hypothetical protein